MSEQHSVEKGLPKYAQAEARAAVQAIRTYLDAVAATQAVCEHPTILKFTSSDYKTTRTCEDCGYSESVQWDSGYKYKDQRLLKRAYAVSWDEHWAARPLFFESSIPSRVTPSGSTDPVSRFVAMENALHTKGCEYPNAECACPDDGDQ